MDLAVDEQGLWALWADTDNAYRLYASKIDVYTNAIIDTRALATGKSMCGTSPTFQRKQNLMPKNLHIFFVYTLFQNGDNFIILLYLC